MLCYAMLCYVAPLCDHGIRVAYHTLSCSGYKELLLTQKKHKCELLPCMKCLTLSMSVMICRMSWSCLRSSPFLQMATYWPPSAVLKVSLIGMRELLNMDAWSGTTPTTLTSGCRGRGRGSKLVKFTDCSLSPNKAWSLSIWGEYRIQWEWKIGWMETNTIKFAMRISTLMSYTTYSFWEKIFQDIFPNENQLLKSFDPLRTSPEYSQAGVYRKESLNYTYKFTKFHAFIFFHELQITIDNLMTYYSL